MQKIKQFLQAYHKELLIVLAICAGAYVIGGLANPFLPIESNDLTKLTHFGTGMLAAWMFWYALEQHRSGNMVSPIYFLFGCLWGSSGFFFFRWLAVLLHVRAFRSSDLFLYMAFPDWDIRLFGIGAHKHILFHSVIFPALLLLVATAKLWKGGRDFAIGLTVGIASHLIWDILHAPYQSIRHMDYTFSSMWILGNAIFGVFLCYYMINHALILIKTE